MAKTNGIENVHKLYEMQNEVYRYVSNVLRSPKQKEDAKRVLREFRSLLKDADARYMGGEDVLSTLQLWQTQLAQKLGA